MILLKEQNQIWSLPVILKVRVDYLKMLPINVTNLNYINNLSFIKITLISAIGKIGVQKCGKFVLCKLTIQGKIRTAWSISKMMHFWWKVWKYKNGWKCTNMVQKCARSEWLKTNSFRSKDVKIQVIIHHLFGTINHSLSYSCFD